MGNCCIRASRVKQINRSVPIHYYEPQHAISPISITTQPNCTTEHVYYAPPYAVSPVQKSCASVRPPITGNLEEIQHIADRELDSKFFNTKRSQLSVIHWHILFCR